jgi:predicted ATPase
MRMIKLKSVEINKYKCIESTQEFEVDPSITVLVGMNESGKTSVLEALAKTNYFQKDPKFKFNATHDYPRKQKKSMDKSGDDPIAAQCTYALSDKLIGKINNIIGEGIFSSKEISITTKYSGNNTVGGVNVDLGAFWNHAISKMPIENKELASSLPKARSKDDITSALAEVEENEDLSEFFERIVQLFENKYEWSNPVEEYIYRTLIKPQLPKFLYYDEYYSLPSRISIEEMMSDSLESDELKTAKALFELADINIDELVRSDDFEDFKAELEATEANISEELFEYWSTNKNLDIQFDIDKVEKTDQHSNTRIVEHILDIRVRNNRTRMSLPLKNRSKGFNWFFSFLVWFKKIQEDSASSYIILLDEPGLNLHASAQADLLRFIENLSENYQILYTTHSPFMVEPSGLHRVRTILDTPKGSVISDSIQEKDPDTLFPLQAALGYDIAQNLFISSKNLLVEGVSDLIYLEVMSGVMQEAGLVPLNESITVVPVGGLEKVSTFVSLLRGSKLKIACLLDSNIDPSSKSKLDHLIAHKIIQKKSIRFYDEFVDDLESADVEDLFEKEEYLKYFNGAFNEHADITDSDLNPDIKQIIIQINNHLGVDRFNHYRPANVLAKSAPAPDSFSKETLHRFSGLFEQMNGLF